MSELFAELEFIKVSEPTPHVLLAELARKPVNAFNKPFWTEYGAFFDKLSEGTYDIRAVVLASSFSTVFVAGVDLSVIEDFQKEDPEPARRAAAHRQTLKHFQHCITAPDRCPIPVIVAISGPVVGLGVDITVACDIRYASSSTMFSMKEVDMGLAADIGTLAYLSKITGNDSWVRELAYTARAFSAFEAQKLGLVSKVVDGSREDVIHSALELAKTIASKSPIAVRGTKRLLIHARDNTIAENLDYTTVWNSAMLQTQDVAESVRASRSKPRRQPLYRAIKGKYDCKL